MENKPNVLVVDGDILNFTIGRATEDITDFDGTICESFDEEAMVRLLEIGLDDIGKKCGYERENIIFSISCEKNYRKRLYPTYKSNRKDVKKPLGLNWLRQYQKDNAEKYNLLLIEELEADDCMGIVGSVGDPTISIYSQDKDLRTIPVRQWDFKLNKFWHPTDLEANRWLYTQVLTGDTVDGYKGCPKIGKVKAEAALKDCKNEMEMLRECLVRYYLAYNKDLDDTKKQFLIQMGQARILHQTDYLQLLNDDTTFNPIRLMNISDVSILAACRGYIENLAEAKHHKAKAVKEKARASRLQKKERLAVLKRMDDEAKNV